MKVITPRQQRIMELFDKGLLPAQIADDLCVSESTVKAQLTRIRRKVKAGSYNPPPLPLEK